MARGFLDSGRRMHHILWFAHRSGQSGARHNFTDAYFDTDAGRWIMRRRLIRVVGPLFLAASLAAAAAEEYPARPVRIIVPFAPGGGTDVVGRILAAHLGQR